MAEDLRIGVAGLGSVAAQILPSFRRVAGVRLVGAADLRRDARESFTNTHGLPAYETVEALCNAPDVDAVWVATPNSLHCDHTAIAARAGKHVICEKPMALTLAESDRMIDAAERAGVRLLQGHSKIFDAPIRAMRSVIDSGRLGQVVGVQSVNFNDWLARPRIAAELDTKAGGGLVYRQGPHQVDIARYLVGSPATRVRGMVGRWNRHFDTEGNFSALIEFENGAAANLSLNGYGYFDTMELTWGIGEGGQVIPEPWRRKRSSAAMTPDQKYNHVAGVTGDDNPYRYGDNAPFFGLTVVSCERGVIRQSPQGLFVYTESGREELSVDKGLGGRAAELQELQRALSEGRRVFPDGIWGRATLEICLGILDSANQRRDVELSHQAE